ncbi:XRE family transcriptional regulator [Comamonas antarctica]|uniref:helix-turn-helix domain-containing protein n=1 Tax=Comamonas antarctica TaxID=2743470 RepID=UPI0028E29F0A|nr:XRE family transcriptional regulator [Comamonas antarctica]
MPPTTSPESLIPRRVRDERTRRGLTLDQLAASAGVSRAMISRIERGQSSPTAVLLSKIGDAMGLSLSALMSEPVKAGPEMRRMAQQPSWADPATGYIRRLVSPPGGDGGVEVVAVELPAGRSVTFAATQSLHSQDQILLLEGRLHLRSADTVYELQPGDCARISTTEENAFGNPAAVPARYLVVKRHYR